MRVARWTLARWTLRWTLGWVLGLVSTHLPVTAQAASILFGSGQVDTSPSVGAFPSLFIGQSPPPDPNAMIVGAAFDFEFDPRTGRLSIDIGGQPFFTVPGPDRSRNADNLVLSGRTVTGFAMFEFVQLSFTAPAGLPFDLALLPPDASLGPDALRVEVICIICSVLNPAVLEGRVLQVGIRQVPEPGAGLYVVVGLAFAAVELRRRTRRII